MSPIALEAAAVVDQIRFEELQTIWTPEVEQSLAEKEGHIYPGMMFSLAKERMESSKLWNIVKKMPKGALLHCHFEAMVEIERILEDAFTMPEVCLVSSIPLSSEAAREKATLSFSICNTPPEPTTSLWSEEYKPDTPVPITSAADWFPNNGRAGFVAYMRTRCAITPREAIRQYDGPNDIWQKFYSTFAIVRSVVFHPPLFRKFVYRVCEQLHADGVEWADIRGVFWDPLRAAEDQPFVDLVGQFGEVVDAFKKSDAGKGFWGMRLIWTWPRAQSKFSIIQAMKHCIKVKKAHPHLIAGFDFVGQEDSGRPLQDLLPEIFWFKKRCVEEGVDLPFFFHAGETLGDGDETDENLFDAVLLGTRRIGHGFSLYKHPLLIDMVKDKKILIESCPISNEVLRYTSSIKHHPGPALLARGVATALSNDDPAMLGHGGVGMSQDFWQVLQGWDNVGLAGLGSLAENSVRWAAFEDQTTKEWLQGLRDGAYGKTVRAERMQAWMKAWEGFCLWVVTEFGADEDFERE